MKGIINVLGTGLKRQLTHPATYSIAAGAALVSGIRTKGDLKAMTDTGINTLVGILGYNVAINAIDLINENR